MKYLFAPLRKYQDLSSGHVICSKPGMSAFPVRLASELFLRGVDYLCKKGIYPPYHLYDPVCGGGFSLTVLGFLHGSLIRRLSASDIDRDTVRVAASNLSLLTSQGMDLRLKNIERLLHSYARPSHICAIESIKSLKKISPLFNSSDINIFTANALSVGAIQKGIYGDKVDIIFADLPYGQLSHWEAEPFNNKSQGTSMGNLLLTEITKLEAIPKIIIISLAKKERLSNPHLHRINSFQSGKRRIAIYTSV